MRLLAQLPKTKTNYLFEVLFVHLLKSCSVHRQVYTVRERIHTLYTHNYNLYKYIYTPYVGIQFIRPSITTSVRCYGL